SNRDAIGARVTVETDRMRRTKTVQANSGFISQHSKELLFGLGKSERVVKVTIDWPSGASQVLSDLPINHRIKIAEGGEPSAAPYRAASKGEEIAAPSETATVPAATWFYDPFPAPDFKLPDLEGKERSLGALRGRPGLLFFWSASVPESLAALRGLARTPAVLRDAGVALLAVALDDSQAAPKVRAAASSLPGVPIVLGDEAVGNAYTLAHHYLYVGREDLPLPSAFLLDARGGIVRAYRPPLEAAEVAADAAKIEATERERLTRAVPFP